jgi:ribose 5-phosphate isomerase
LRRCTQCAAAIQNTGKAIYEADDGHLIVRKIIAMTSKLTIALQDNLLELVQTLGEPATVVPAAVRRYVVDRSLQRLEAAEERIRVYAQRYQMDYVTFNRCVVLDQAFLDRLNQEHPLWEADAIEWAQWTEEVELWRERLTQALQTSSPSLVPA